MKALKIEHNNEELGFIPEIYVDYGDGRGCILHRYSSKFDYSDYIPSFPYEAEILEGVTDTRWVNLDPDNQDYDNNIVIKLEISPDDLAGEEVYPAKLDSEGFMEKIPTSFSHFLGDGSFVYQAENGHKAYIMFSVGGEEISLIKKILNLK